MNRRHNVNDFFRNIFSNEFLLEAEINYKLTDIAIKAFRILQDSKQSYRIIAQKMGHKSTGTVQRIINISKPENVKLATLIKFANACGYELDIKFKKKE